MDMTMSPDETTASAEALHGMRERIAELEQAEARLKQAEAVLAGRNQVLERLAFGAPLEEILSLLIEVAEDFRPELTCSVLLLDCKNGRLQHGAAPGLPDFYNRAVNGLRIGPGVGSCGTAAYTGQRVVVEDVATHPYWSDFQDLAERAGIRACWSEPILSSGGDILGTFAMYYRRPCRPEKHELELIHSFAQLAGIAIERRRLDESLETSVQDRTRQLSEANESLKREVAERKQAEHRFRRLLEAAPDAMVIVDRQGRIVLANEEAEKVFGYTRAELLGQPLEMLVPERFRERHVQSRHAFAGCPHVRAMGAGPELYGRRKDGSEFQAEISLGPIQTEEGLLVSSAIRDITERKRVERFLHENSAQMLAAQKIQQRLLPSASPNIPGFDIAGAVYPAEFAAGDYFDYLPMADQSVGVVVGDVSGHGLGPSLLMASTHAYLRTLSQSGNNVPDMLAMVNSSLLAETEDDRFVTMLFACINPKTRTIVCANAGHPTGYVLDSPGAIKALLESEAMPLGVMPGTKFPVGEPITLDPGDLVVLLTDGILEAMAPDGEFFGSQRVLDVVRENRHGKAAEITVALREAVRVFSQQEDLTDDVTAVVIKVEQAG
jgi:PAS domain S-box-containing protein